MIKNTLSGTRGLFKQQHVKAGFLHLFGTSSYLTLILVCATMVSLSWFGDTLWTLMTDFQNTFQCYKTALGVFAFPVTISIWYVLIEKSMDEMIKLDVKETTDVPGCRALIVFLSKPGEQDKAMVNDLFQEGNALPDDAIMERAFRERFISGWRMPLEAVAYHLTKGLLDRVLVIPSRDGCRKQPDGTVRPDRGTHLHFPAFKNLLESVTSGRVAVSNIGEADGRWQTGVDYEGAGELHDCLHDAFSWLKNQGYNTVKEVIVDITSGQKIGSSVATVMSLDLGRQVQYVSTNDYTLKSFDITYEKE